MTSLLTPAHLAAPSGTSDEARAVAWTVEHLVALDIEAYSQRESVRRRARARATMDRQALTRLSPASFRKNG